VRFEAFTAVMFQVEVFWVVTLHSVVVGYPEDGGNVDLWNNGILPQHYTVSQSRKPQLEIFCKFFQSMLLITQTFMLLGW